MHNTPLSGTRTALIIGLGFIVGACGSDTSAPAAGSTPPAQQSATLNQVHPVSRNGLIFVTGGPGFNPETARGAWSGFFRYEEKILTALYRQALGTDSFSK